MEDKKHGSRVYKSLPIANTVVIDAVKYLSVPDGWVMETADFTELSYFLGYKFEPRSMYAIWSPEGIARGGHLESRSKLSTVVVGTIYYVLVDMRPGPERGKTFEFYLGDGEQSMGRSVLIPEGVVDAFIPVGGEALTHQVGDRPYNKFDNRRTLNIFDPEIGFHLPKGSKQHAREGEEALTISLKEFQEALK